MATLTFFGAVEGVTGSCYLIRTDSVQVLLECGLYQGRAEEVRQNAQPFPFDPEELDAVILSHAHLDHSGRLPKLVSDGYRGKVYTTRATLELLEIMLKDAAFLNERDIEWQNRRRARSGKPLLEPLYTLEDVENAFAQCEGVTYDRRITVAGGIELCFREAGHILGSALVELYVSDKGVTRKLVFSGDLGNDCAALLRDPEIINEADLVMLESTYGDHDHRSHKQTLDELHDILSGAADEGTNVLIPSFAVGRTQELLFRLGEFYQAGELKQQLVMLDSPMAIAATEVYHRYLHVFNQEDAQQMAESRATTLHSFLPILRYSRTAEESIAINRIKGGAIIIAGSGMCDGGRIRHHFKHNLWRKGTHVIIVGYQAYGTPGRALIDGAKTLHLFGEEVVVKANVHTLGGFSAHAGQSQLREWLNNFSAAAPRVFLVHGEEEKKQALRSVLAKDGWQAQIPGMGETVSL